VDEHYKYGTLIAKLLRGDINHGESKELDEWINDDPDNLRLLEALMNDFKVEWARKWFAEAGVSTRGIKWKKTTGWYKRDKNMWDFYLVIICTVLFMALVYFVNHL
jgi:hypothetical protein